jgi:hypothetical protein
MARPRKGQPTLKDGVPFSLRLSNNMYAGLDKVATEEYRPIANVIKIAVIEFLDRRGIQATMFDSPEDSK